jgi:hypothetical protein
MVGWLRQSDGRAQELAERPGKMMNLIAERLRRRWRLPWPRSSAVSGPRREGGQARTAVRMEPRQNTGLEEGADVLEEIWRAT